MGYTAKNFRVEKFATEFPDVYGRVNSMEVNVKNGYCRLDLQWFSSKEASLTADPLDSWSFVLPPETMLDMLKNQDSKTALQVGYEAIRSMDEKFESIQDDI
jgi:hypothetical protein